MVCQKKARERKKYFVWTKFIHFHLFMVKLILHILKTVIPVFLAIFCENVNFKRSKKIKFSAKSDSNKWLHFWTNIGCNSVAFWGNFNELLMTCSYIWGLFVWYLTVFLENEQHIKGKIKSLVLKSFVFLKCFQNSEHYLTEKSCIYLADPGKARGCSINTSVGNSVIHWVIL